QVHPMASPRVEVVGRGDGPAALGRGPYGQVLFEGRGPVDGGLVDLLVLVDVVRSAVAGDLAHVRACRVRRAGVVLLDVVLDERVGRPAVERYQRGARGAETTGEAHRGVAAGVEANAGDEVAHVAPRGGVAVARVQRDAGRPGARGVHLVV